MRTAECLSHIKPYMFVEINRKRDALIAAGHDVINLSIGDPDGPTPQHIVDAMIDFVQDPANHHYPPYAGTAEFKQAAASWMKGRFDVDLDPETEVLALIGSKEGLAHLHTAFVDPGDYVLAPSIGYAVYAGGATLNNANTYYLPMNEENGFLADFENVPEEVLAKAKIMFLGYPNNPTGAVAPIEYFDRAIEFCIKHDLLLCHDNAYSEICYEGYQAPSILQRPRAKECCIEFFSLSKPYNMTGWRLGFAVGNPQAVGALGTIKNNTDSGVFTAIQKAGVVAMTSSQECVANTCALYEQRRDLMVKALTEAGLTVPTPKATFYIWAKVPTGYTSASFCEKMLEEAYVVLTPGSGYGPDGEGYVRISLTCPDERIVEAARRIKDCM